MSLFTLTEKKRYSKKKVDLMRLYTLISAKSSQMTYNRGGNNFSIMLKGIR